MRGAEAIAGGRLLAQTPEPVPDRDGEPHRVPAEPPPEPPDPNPVHVPPGGPQPAELPSGKPD